MPNSRDMESQIAEMRRILTLVPSQTVLGRLSSPRGRIEYIDAAAMLAWIGYAGNWQFNSLRCDDDFPLYCSDGFALYETGNVIDNPPSPTRYVDTVADVLALESQTWDRAVAMNDLEIGDGLRSEWRMLTAPWVSDQTGFNLRAMDDGGGFAERLANLR